MRKNLILLCLILTFASFNIVCDIGWCIVVVVVVVVAAVVTPYIISIMEEDSGSRKWVVFGLKISYNMLYE